LTTSKYLVGADGGRSTVRTLAGIKSTTDSTTLRWVRLDGVVETDMPDSKLGFASVESPTHGNVLWVSLDHGRTRVGYALSKDLYEKYGENMTQEQAIKEAQAGMLPFKVEFKSVDWYTVYG
jgi:phenol 2-monooxygenase